MEVIGGRFFFLQNKEKVYNIYQVFIIHQPLYKVVFTFVILSSFIQPYKECINSPVQQIEKEKKILQLSEVKLLRIYHSAEKEQCQNSNLDFSRVQRLSPIF